MHSIAPTQKILTFTCKMLTQKHTQHAPSTKTDCDYLSGWIKKRMVTYTKIWPKAVNPRNTAGNTEEEGEDLIGRPGVCYGRFQCTWYMKSADCYFLNLSGQHFFRPISAWTCFVFTCTQRIKCACCRSCNSCQHWVGLQECEYVPSMHHSWKWAWLAG